MEDGNVEIEKHKKKFLFCLLKKKKKKIFFQLKIKNFTRIGFCRIYCLINKKNFNSLKITKDKENKLIYPFYRPHISMFIFDF